MPRFRRLVRYAASTLALFAASHAGAFDKLVVFGDSLSDGGNAFNTVDVPFLYPNGFPPPPNNQRNSDGLVAVEYLAQRLGVDLKPSTVTGGTNYAYSGAMTGQRSGVFPTPPLPGGVAVTTENYADPVYGATQLRSGTSLTSQVGSFIGAGAPFSPDSTLFVVWAGANDFFFAPESATVASSIQNIGGAIHQLAQIGAKKFLVPGLPDLSLTPAILELDAAAPGFGIGAGYRDLSLTFNMILQSTVSAIESGYQAVVPGFDITYFDVNASLLGVLSNPAGLGLSNTTQGCNNITFTSTCANPDQYLFWDPVHPTDVVHAELGRQFAQAVPEPEAWALMAVGLVVLGAARCMRLKSLA